LTHRLRSELSLLGQVTASFSGDLCNSNEVDRSAYGTYTATGICVLSCNLVLDGGPFTFKCNNGLITAADTSVDLTNGATAVWDVVGTASTGAGSIMNGVLTADAAITFGAETTWTGDLTSTAGAIDLGVQSSVIGNVEAFGAITLAALANTNPGTLISTNGAVDLAPYAIARGDIQASGAITLAALASAENCDLTSVSGAVSLGARAKCQNISARGAITLGANAQSLIGSPARGTSTSYLSSTHGAITLGANAQSGTISAPNGAITIGANAWYTSSSTFI
jgi:hypothetical protein